MRGYSRSVCLLAFCCVVLSSASSCERRTDCHGFLDAPPTFELVDRLGDEGVPFYDTRNVRLNSDEFASLPSCESFDGLALDSQLALSNVVDGGGQCGQQTADAQIGGTFVPYSLPDDRTTLLLSGDLTTSNPAVLVGGEAVSVAGCVGQWAAMVSASYTGEPTDDPGEGAYPPWTITRLFRPGAGTGCEALVDCVDVFTARIVVGR